MEPRIQELVEEYFKRPLTPEEGQRLSQFLATSPEETQRFVQRMEILNARAETPGGTAREVTLKDLAPRKDPPWAKTLFWVFLSALTAFLYWRFTSPLDRDADSPSPVRQDFRPEDLPKGGAVKVFQSRKSLPPPQISTPIPFKGGDPKREAPLKP